MEIICYKAGKKENPENTIQAIENCTRINMNWTIHIDIQLTKDNKVVLFDKDNTKSITGIDNFIGNTSLKELKKLDAAYNFKQDGEYIYRNQSILIPTLEEVFEKFPITKFILDIKTINKQVVFETIKLIEKYNMVNKVVLSSKHDDIISLFKSERTNWKYAATTVGSRKVLYENMFYIDNIIPEDADILLIPKSDKGSLFVREKIVEYCNHRNKQTWTWIFEESEKMSLAKQVEDLKNIEVKGVFTSYPLKMNAELEYQNENIIQTMYRIV